VSNLGGWQECKDPIRVAFHPFKTVPWLQIHGAQSDQSCRIMSHHVALAVKVTDHRICQQSAEMAAIAA